MLDIYTNVLRNACLQGQTFVPVHLCRHTHTHQSMPRFWSSLQEGWPAVSSQNLITNEHDSSFCWCLVSEVITFLFLYFIPSHSGSMSAISSANAVFRCALTDWCSTACRYVSSSSRPRTKVGASAVWMMWPRAPLSAYMLVR